MVAQPNHAKFDRPNFHLPLLPDRTPCYPLMVAAYAHAYAGGCKNPMAPSPYGQMRNPNPYGGRFYPSNAHAMAPDVQSCRRDSSTQVEVGELRTIAPRPYVPACPEHKT